MPTVHLITETEGTDAQGRRTRRRIYAVDGVSSPTAARLAPGVPQWGTPYSFSEPYLVVVGTEASPEGGQLNTNSYRVDVSYEVKPNGGQQKAPENPLLIPTRWSILITGTQQQYDLDGKGRPITNSAGERSTQPFTRIFSEVQLTAKRWVQAANVNALIGQAIKYSDGYTNSDPWVFGLTKGQALCLGGGPAGEFYEKGNSILEMAWTFSIKQSGHKFRMKDEGFKIYNPNYGKSATTYQNVDQKYIQLATDAQQIRPHLLDGYGRKLGDTSNSKGPAVVGATIETTADAVFLNWDKYGELPYKALKL